VPVKTVPVGILGTAENDIGINCNWTFVESAMKFAKLAEAELRTIPGTTEIKLTVEDGTRNQRSSGLIKCLH
jgi:HAE1 family hydrophobic/amphiphilic exporter-1